MSSIYLFREMRKYRRRLDDTESDPNKRTTISVPTWLKNEYGRMGTKEDTFEEILTWALNALKAERKTKETPT